MHIKHSPQNHTEVVCAINEDSIAIPVIAEFSQLSAEMGIIQ
jgi:hypothetical protein